MKSKNFLYCVIKEEYYLDAEFKIVVKNYNITSIMRLLAAIK